MRSRVRLHFFLGGSCDPEQQGVVARRAQFYHAKHPPPIVCLRTTILLIVVMTNLNSSIAHALGRPVLSPRHPREEIHGYPAKRPSASSGDFGIFIFGAIFFCFPSLAPYGYHTTASKRQGAPPIYRLILRWVGLV